MRKTTDKTIRQSQKPVSGLWVGEAWPDKNLKDNGIPTNPIRWSLTIEVDEMANSEEEMSIFGAGFFDDAVDVQGEIVFFTLRGKFDPKTNAIKLEKAYDVELVHPGLYVTYEGTLQLHDDKEINNDSESIDNRPMISGTWKNSVELTHGSFRAYLQVEGTVNH